MCEMLFEILCRQAGSGGALSDVRGEKLAQCRVCASQPGLGLRCGQVRDPLAWSVPSQH